MTTPPTLKTLTAALREERRAGTRLRTVIADLEEAVQANRRDLEVQFTRMAHLQADLDRLKKRTESS